MGHTSGLDFALQDCNAKQACLQKYTTSAQEAAWHWLHKPNNDVRGVRPYIACNELLVSVSIAMNDVHNLEP